MCRRVFSCLSAVFSSPPRQRAKHSEPIELTPSVSYFPLPCSLPAITTTICPTADRALPARESLRRAHDGPAPRGAAHRAPAVHGFPGYLRPGDLAVLNDARVIPARLFANDGALELLVVERAEPTLWTCLVKPGRKARLGAHRARRRSARHRRTHPRGRRAGHPLRRRDRPRNRRRAAPAAVHGARPRRNPTARATRPCSPASPGPSRHPRPGCTSRRKFSRACRTRS